MNQQRDHLFGYTHTTRYRLKCPCSGEREDHELHMRGYEGASNPAVWVDLGSYYECLKCGRRVPWRPPPPSPLPPRMIIELDDP